VTDAALILNKLSTLREHVDRARRRRPASAEILRQDVDLQDALAMSLLVAIQEAADIAFHICADEGWGMPGSYADAFHILARHRVVDASLADELARIVAVRHRLAHGYATVDLDRLWTELPAGLGALDRFAAAIVAFVVPPTC
jgi:uncharacterized protein YutE (UPF0331/DUF86 family)